MTPAAKDASPTSSPKKKIALPTAEGRLGGAFSVDPSKVLIIGRDPPTQKMTSHPLYTHRALEASRPELVQAFLDGTTDVSTILVTKVANLRRDLPDPIWEGIDSDTPVVVVGRSRIIAARAAQSLRVQEAVRLGLAPPLVPILLGAMYTSAPLQELGLKVLMENALRKDPDPITQAEDAQRQINYAQGDRLRVAKALGITPQGLHLRLRLLELPERDRHRVASGELSQDAALALLDLSSEERALAEKEIELSKVEQGAESEPTPGKKRKGPTKRQIQKAAGRRVAPSKKEVIKTVTYFEQILDDTISEDATKTAKAILGLSQEDLDIRPEDTTGRFQRVCGMIDGAQRALCWARALPVESKKE